MPAVLDRRTLLKLGAAALAAAQMGACSNGISSPLAPGQVRAVLARFASDLFPHESVGDDKYMALATAFADQNQAIAADLAGLLSEPYRPYDSRPPSQRHALIEAHFTAPGLQAYRFAVLVGLYDDLDVTRAFGYQGPSILDGGYLDRGFDDLDWLPEPA